MSKKLSLDQLVQEVREFSRLMVRELGLLSDCVPNSKMTNAECHLLLELEKHGTLMAKELSEQLRVDKSNVSRLVTHLSKKGWIKSKPDLQDSRKKYLELSSSGREQLAVVHRNTNRRVSSALLGLSEKGRLSVAEGLSQYALALRRSRLSQELKIRIIEPRDNLELSRVILKVLKSFVGDRPGFASGDMELRNMAESYSKKGRRFFVVESGNRIVGGAGIAPLQGGDGKTCELRKMYLLPEIQGLGVGKRLMDQCLSFAKEAGYTSCYLETLHCMTAANALYDRYGFKDLSAPRGSTGHHGCDRWRETKLRQR